MHVILFDFLWPHVMGGSFLFSVKEAEAWESPASEQARRGENPWILSSRLDPTAVLSLCDSTRAVFLFGVAVCPHPSSGNNDSLHFTMRLSSPLLTRKACTSNVVPVCVLHGLSCCPSLLVVGFSTTKTLAGQDR